MSLRIAILRILAARPDGTVAFATVRSELALLMSSGRWSGSSDPHVRRNAPPPDLFSSGFVSRTSEHWQISAAGRAYLKAYGDGRFAIEEPAPEPVTVRADRTDADVAAAKPVVIVDNPAIDTPDLERLLPPLPPLRIATIARRPRVAGRR